MEKAPRNKMVENGQEEVKASKSGRTLGKEVKKFYFPHFGRSVEAESLEEATAIINKTKK